MINDEKLTLANSWHWWKNRHRQNIRYLYALNSWWNGLMTNNMNEILLSGENVRRRPNIGRVEASYTIGMCFHLIWILDFMFIIVFSIYLVTGCICLIKEEKKNREDRNINGFMCSCEGLSDYWKLDWLLDLWVTMRGY